MNEYIPVALLELIMQELVTHSNSCADIDKWPANAMARPV